MTAAAGFFDVNRCEHEPGVTPRPLAELLGPQRAVLLSITANDHDHALQAARFIDFRG
jgi:hypothetical protein